MQKQQSDIWKQFTKTIAEKVDLKTDLVTEQGYLCCYCQKRIYIGSNTQIEQFIPRSLDALQMFDYNNLLASCDGGQKERTDSSTDNKIDYIPKFCGAAKDNDLLAISPLQNDCETFFDYVIGENFEIEIIGKTSEATQTVDLLNLNLPHLKRLRGDFIKNLVVDENNAFLSKNDLLIIKNKILSIEDNKRYPFCTIIHNIIEKII